MSCVHVQCVAGATLHGGMAALQAFTGAYAHCTCARNCLSLSPSSRWLGFPKRASTKVARSLLFLAASQNWAEQFGRHEQTSNAKAAPLLPWQSTYLLQMQSDVSMARLVSC